MAITSGREAKYQVVANDLKSLISAGRYKKTNMLPTQAQLSKKYDVSIGTVERAITRLSQLGLVRPERGRGLLVIDRTATGEYAIVAQNSLFGQGSSSFTRLVCSALTDLLQSKYPRCYPKLHMYGNSNYTPTTVDVSGRVDLLEPSVLSRLRGVFSIDNISAAAESLARHGVSVVSVSSPMLKYGVGLDADSFTDKAFRFLGSIGCRDVAVIGAEVHDAIYGNDIFCRRIKAPFCKDRLTSSSKGIHLEDRTDRTSFEEAGYELFKRLWANGDHPDAVLVLDDNICRGVLRAMLQLGVSLPRDIKLISQTNSGDRIPYHKDITRLELNLQNWAAEAVKMMETLSQGRKPEPAKIYITPELIVGDTT